MFDWKLVSRALPSYFMGAGKAAYPRIIKYDVTYRCKLNCSFCFYWSDSSRKATSKLIKSRRELTSGEIEKYLVPILIKNKVEFISISGGEPLSRPDLPEILYKIDKANLAIGVNTSLDGLTDDVLAAFEKINLRYIQFSLHGVEDVHNNLVRRKDGYEKLIANVKRLKSSLDKRKEKTDITCCYVVVPENQYNISKSVLDMEKLGVNKFYIHFLEWQENSNSSEQSLTSRALMTESSHRFVDEDVVYKQIMELRSRAKKGGIEVYCHPFEPSSKEEISKWYNDPLFNKVKNCFCLWLEARIDPFGDIIPCLYITEPSGNIINDSFSDIWEGEKLKNIRYEIQRNLRPVCKKCCKLSRTWQNILVNLP